ncbi:hypothetical protein E2C01_054672 [Portunus trituberculatus]|uniref:Uncharacterized protein n=1 Tax=Portunus trituberculatus TaxID=210409 RepID=A0A5B7GSM2_PORTR|nr:hypothetical protein [Portunus trituberculatus]
MLRADKVVSVGSSRRPRVGSNPTTCLFGAMSFVECSTRELIWCTKLRRHQEELSAFKYPFPRRQGGRVQLDPCSAVQSNTRNTSMKHLRRYLARVSIHQEGRGRHTIPAARCLK